MKKILILGAFAVTLFACKDDKNSNADTKTANLPEGIETNDKGIAVIDTKDSTKVQQLEVAFYASEEGSYHYQYNLEKGKTYPFHSRSVDTYTASRDKKSLKIITEMVDKIDFSVLENKGNYYVMQAKYVSTKNTVKADGQIVTVDSEQPEPKNEALKNDWNIRKALMGNSFSFQLSKSGKISNITGLDKFYASVESKLKGKFSGEQLKSLMEMVKKNIVNADVFKQQFETTMIEFPEKGIKLGETWKVKGIQSYTTFKLNRIDDKNVEITFSASLPSDTKSDEKQGLKMTATKSGTNSGKILFNKNSGWIDKGENTSSITIKVTQSYQGKSMSQTENKTIKTYINQ